MDLNGFNPQQHEAITLSADSSVISDILLVAGAGSGKTRVLTYRVAWLREQGIPYTDILALTFTKKAANEMNARYMALVKDRAPVKMSTFHSLAADLLRNYREQSFDIIDDNDQNKIIKDIIKDLDLKDQVKLKDYKGWLSYQRNKCKDPLLGRASDKAIIQAYRLITKQYVKVKKQIGAGVFDFDDLLEELVKLLDDRPRIREQLHQRWRYILVDEYQDTNRLQFKILSSLRGPETQLLQVGDEDQLIYSWRGAEIDHIMRSYQSSLEDARVHCIMLNTNYRCTGNILEVANKVVGVNVVRTGKTLVPHHKPGEPVTVEEYGSCDEESKGIASQLARWEADGTAFDNMAVLMRTNRMARSVERALIQEGVPYHMHNGVALFDSREVRLLMALLWFASDPDESFFFQQILDTIKMNIGPSMLKKLEQQRGERGLNWIELLSSLPKQAEKQRVKEFLLFYPEAHEHVVNGQLGDAARSWLHNWDLMQFYKEDEREKKTETLQTFFGVLDDYEHQARLRGVEPNIRDFQEQRLLNDALTDKEDGGAVHLMTIHKSKGLEFERGYVMGMQDGVFPMNQDGMGDGDNEEDARLGYVSITRFMRELRITRANFRVGFNDISMFSTLLDVHSEELEKKGALRYERHERR